MNDWREIIFMMNYRRDKQKKGICAVAKETDVNEEEGAKSRCFPVWYGSLENQSPVRRLRSLTASSEPSSLKSTSLKPTEPITDAREPGEEGAWFPANRKHKGEQLNNPSPIDGEMKK